MVDAARTELCAHPVGSGQTKVCDSEPQTVIKAENILWLEIAVINTERVAILNRIEQLKEYLLDQLVIAQVSTMLEDLGEEIAIGAVVHDDPRVVIVFNNAVKSDDTGMRRCELMEGDFSDVQLPLAGCVALRGVGKAFDGVRCRLRCVRVNGAVDDAVSTVSENLDELE